jgi:hypothetical protein
MFFLEPVQKGGSALALTRLDVERDSVIPDAPGSPPPRRSRRWIIGALLFALCAAAVGYLTGNEVQANTQFDRAQNSLNVTTHHLDTVLADLRTIRQELDVVNGQVSTDSTALTQDTMQLQGAQKVLANAQAAVANQTSTNGDLQACLGGVEQALNALAVGDQARAISALDATSTSCANAVAADG